MGGVDVAFSRHDGIYRSDVFNPSYKPGPDLPAFRSGPAQVLKRAGRKHAYPSSATSSDRLFLNGLLASVGPYNSWAERGRN